MVPTSVIAIARIDRKKRNLIEGSRVLLALRTRMRTYRFVDKSRKLRYGRINQAQSQGEPKLRHAEAPNRSIPLLPFREESRGESSPGPRGIEGKGEGCRSRTKGQVRPRGTSSSLCSWTRGVRLARQPTKESEKGEDEADDERRKPGERLSNAYVRAEIPARIERYRLSLKLSERAKTSVARYFDPIRPDFFLLRSCATAYLKALIESIPAIRRIIHRAARSCLLERTAVNVRAVNFILKRLPSANPSSRSTVSSRHHYFIEKSNLFEI